MKKILSILFGMYICAINSICFADGISFGGSRTEYIINNGINPFIIFLVFLLILILLIVCIIKLKELKEKDEK